MKRIVAILMAVLFVSALAMPALAQSPPGQGVLTAAPPSTASSVSSSGSGTDTAGATQSKHRHRKRHHKSMKGTSGSSPAAEGKSSREQLKGEAVPTSPQ
jgi:hypothetical protein